MRDLIFAASNSHGGGAEAKALWGPRFGGLLGGALGVEVRLHLAADFEALLHEVSAGAVDVAWLPPLLHARAEAAGAKLVAITQRSGWLTYRSAVLVRRDATYRDARDLVGVRAAWVDPHSASGYFFPRLELTALGATFSAEAFHGHPERSFAAVAGGLADLCACFVGNPTPDRPARAAEDVARTAGVHAAALRILHVTDQIPPDGIAVGPRVSPEEAERIAAALTALHESEAGRSVLQELLHADRFVALTPTLRATLRTWLEAAASRVA